MGMAPHGWDTDREVQEINLLLRDPRVAHLMGPREDFLRVLDVGAQAMLGSPCVLRAVDVHLRLETNECVHAQLEQTREDSVGLSIVEAGGVGPGDDAPGYGLRLETYHALKKRPRVRPRQIIGCARAPNCTTAWAPPFPWLVGWEA